MELGTVKVFALIDNAICFLQSSLIVKTLAIPESSGEARLLAISLASSLVMEA